MAMEMDTLEIAERAIAKISNRFPNLRMQRIPGDPVEMSITFPVQPELKKEVWLALQSNDELSFSVGSFQVEWFPCTNEARVNEYIQAVTGFLSGEYRVLEHYRGAECVKAQLQRPLEGGGWKTEATWSKLWWPFPCKKHFKEVRNA